MKKLKSWIQLQILKKAIKRSYKYYTFKFIPTDNKSDNELYNLIRLSLRFSIPIVVNNTHIYDTILKKSKELFHISPIVYTYNEFMQLNDKSLNKYSRILVASGFDSARLKTLIESNNNVIGYVKGVD